MTIINRGLPNIIVPLNEKSWTIFYNGHEIEGDYLVLPIPRDELIEISKVGFFTNLNMQFDVLIGEYEEDEICGIDKLEKLKKIVDAYLKQSSSPSLKYYFQKTAFLVDKAIEFDTVVMFYL